MPQPDQVCPWCHTEIVWDPEIGPEDTCPHCLNELGDYREIKLKVKQDGQRIVFDDEDDDEDWDEADVLDNEPEWMDEYEEGVQRLLDQQEEAPECSVCRSLMLAAGTVATPESFVPQVREELGEPLLRKDFAAQLYVCPSCFKTERILSEPDRLAMIELLKRFGQAD